MSEFEGALVGLGLLALWFLDRLVGAVRQVANHLDRLATLRGRRDAGTVELP